jgi:hypothetical protein
MTFFAVWAHNTLLYLVTAYYKGSLVSLSLEFLLERLTIFAHPVQLIAESRILGH